MQTFTNHEELLDFGGKVFSVFEEEQPHICDDYEALEELKIDGVTFKRFLANEPENPIGIFCYEAYVDNVSIDVWYFKNIVLSKVTLNPTSKNKFLSKNATVSKKKEYLKEQLMEFVEMQYFN